MGLALASDGWVQAGGLFRLPAAEFGLFTPPFLASSRLKDYILILYRPIPVFGLLGGTNQEIRGVLRLSPYNGVKLDAHKK